MEELAIPSLLFILVPWMLGFGVAAAWSAARLGRLRLVWFGFGAVLGPIALLLLRRAPPALCRSCGSPTRGWLTTCWWCRASVFGDSGPGTTAVPVSRPSRVPVSRPVATDGGRSGAARPTLRARLEASAGTNLPAAPSTGSPATSIRARRTPRSAAPAVAVPLRSGTPTSREAAGGKIADGEPRRVTALPPSPVPSVPPPAGAGASPSRPGPQAPPNMATSPIASALEPGDPSGILATAVYVAGSTNLDAGHRYAIAVRDGRILILGPAEVAPDRIALERPVAGLDARSVEGRLVLADPNGLVLAFMGVAGPPTRDVAAAISHAGRGDP